MRHELFDLLACPECHGGLRWPDGDNGAITCTSCPARYPLRDGIPVLLPPHLDVNEVHDELEHAHGHKQGQAEYFDRQVAEEFEVTRPHGQPEIYGWLLSQKFRRAAAALPPLRGLTVADACCGSGLDAEMLAREGARVIAMDISEGCAQRARERASRYGLDYAVVVADVESLPLVAASVDVSFVHDGLHHLADPRIGIAQLARVARTAVSINEPAAAFATRIAVRLGLSIDVEGAGNRVARLEPGAIADVLAGHGYAATAQRYAMVYRHEPGAVMRAASRPGAASLYRGMVRASNAAIGRWGNKLNVTGLRRAA
jgi:uncharacterized protein YbaR (Trm112 family)